jgi:phage/plasmid primase-like uncharacterized protein
MPDPLQAFRGAILAALGHAPDAIQAGRLQRFATREQRGDRAGWCKLFADGRAGVFGCWRRGIVETWTAADRRSLTPSERAALTRAVEAARREREQQQRAEWAINAKRNASLWARCEPVREGDPVNRYLCRRLAIDAFEAPPCLRAHRALDYWHEGELLGAFAAMVAQVAAPDGRVVALHRTYLTDDGRKADVRIAKKLTGACGPLAGASIRLGEPARGVLGVAEGIETALAASLASGVPTVAASCANALAGFQWPRAVLRLVVFADADKAGREAADTLRARALAARLHCDGMTPTTEGADWCDVWAARDAVLIEAGSAA